VAVIGFGLLQALVLPADFLTHLGYGQATIVPFETVDQKLDYVRVQSTLRGSNPLGAYLVIILTAIVVLLRRGRRHRRVGLAAMLLAGGGVLLATYSRSAYLGILLTVAVLLVLALHGRMMRRKVLWGLAVAAVLAAGVLTVLRDNDQVQNTLFHTDENSTSATSSNQQRASALQAGFDDVLAEPFGRGPGTAGPASAHNGRPARIAENYYLQIGQETGWLGLGLFVAIVVMVAKRLWLRRGDPLAKVLLASLVGLSFINLVQHAWADDTLAIIWWGFAGIAMSIPLAAKSTKGRKADVEA
jgi:O-antigen ligase